EAVRHVGRREGDLHEIVLADLDRRRRERMLIAVDGNLPDLALRAHRRGVIHRNPEDRSGHARRRDDTFAAELFHSLPPGLPAAGATGARTHATTGPQNRAYQ